MAEEENVFIHDATPTWSGFIYQGQVAIYLAVSKICDLRDKGLQKDIIESDYWLEVEKGEDIAIVKKDRNDKQYLSIHQVKNEKDTGIHAYRNPLIQLMLEKGFWKKNKLGEPEAYLHISKRVKEDNHVINQQLSDWAKCIREFYNDIKVFIDKNIDDAERDSFYQEIGGKIENEPIKMKRARYKALIGEIKKSCDDKNYDLVRTKLKELAEYLENMLAVNYIDEKVMLFQYNDKKLYCEGTELFKKIVEQVKRYKNNDKNIANEQYEYITDKLLHYMRGHILKRHHTMQKNGIIKTDISFNEIAKILDESISKYETEANILALRRGYEETLSKYCRVICKHQCEKTGNYKCRLYMNEYKKMGLKDADFIRMCFGYNPDCDKSIDNRECIRKLLKEEGLLESTFEILKQVSNENFIKENNATRVIVNDKNNNALLTAIAGTNSEIAVENIVKGINNNSELVSLVFEADELITVQLSAEGEVWDNDYAEIEDRFISSNINNDSDDIQNSVCKPKKPRFVTAKDVIKQLS